MVNPEVCFSTNESGDLIVIRRGSMGYWPYHDAQGRSKDELNKIEGVNKSQEAAMKAGSMFGWNTKGADPAYYDQNGQLLPSSQCSENKKVEK